MTYDELNARQYALAYAILGGSPAPFMLDTVSTEDLVGLIKAERAQARDTQDALVASAAAEARKAALREAAEARGVWFEFNSQGEPTGEYCTVDAHDPGGMKKYVNREAILALIK